MPDLYLDIISIKTKISREIENATANLEKFQTQFMDNPSYQLSWADDAFERAAKLAVFKQVKLVTDTLTESNFRTAIDSIKSFSLENVISGAKSPVKSTSVCSHLIHEYVTAAWAKVYDEFSAY
jgi:hypothetical protein